MADPLIPPPAPGARRFLGIDPGNAACGFGLVDRSGNRFAAITWGVWRAETGEARAAALSRLADRLGLLLAEAAPQVIAIEQAFLGKNIQSALRLGEARGALLAAASRSGIAVREYPTATVKKAVTGNGRAEKTQVQFMIQRLLGMAAPPRPLDASDALAIAFVAASEPPPPAAAGRAVTPLAGGSPLRPAPR